MTEHIQQVRQMSNNGVTSRTTRVIDEDEINPASTSQVQATSTASRVVWFIAGVLIVLLAFRFVFLLLGANPANGFAHFIYSVSYPFAAPFFGIFGYTVKYGVSRIELSTLVAIAVYGLLAFGITRLVTIRQPRAEN